MEVSKTIDRPNFKVGHEMDIEKLMALCKCIGSYPVNEKYSVVTGTSVMEYESCDFVFDEGISSNTKPLNVNKTMRDRIFRDGWTPSGIICVLARMGYNNEKQLPGILIVCLGSIVYVKGIHFVPCISCDLLEQRRIYLKRWDELTRPLDVSGWPGRSIFPAVRKCS